MTNNRYTHKKYKRVQNTETRTIPINNFSETITTPDFKNRQPDSQYYELYKKLIELEGQCQALNTQFKNLNSIVCSMRKKENRLLNRFGWTLIMANVLLGILAGAIVFGYFQFFYPVLQKNVNSEGLMELLKWIMFLILGTLVGIWISVLKFADYIKKRDQNDL